jgi:hypothetical protein
LLNIRRNILVDDKTVIETKTEHISSCIIYKRLSFLGNVDRTLYLLRKTAYKGFCPLPVAEQMDIKPKQKHLQYN